MKQPLQLLLLVFTLATLFTQCKSSDTAGTKLNMKKPESVALAFTQNLAKMDVAAAKELSTEDTKKVLDFLEMAMTMAGEEELAKMKEEAEQNSKYLKKATCTITGDDAKCVLCCNPEGAEMADNEVILKKQDGKWLVHISKEDMMEGMDAGEIEEEGGE